MEKIRGVSFRAPLKSLDLLQRILNGIDLEALNWFVIENQTEVWEYPNYSAFLENAYYNGEDFSLTIKSPHYIIFLKLQAYLRIDNSFKDIHTYEDFLSSDCLFLLLVYDCEYVEIYLKDAKTVNKIIKNAKEARFEEITIITDENDARTKLDIISTS